MIGAGRSTHHRSSRPCARNGAPPARSPVAPLNSATCRSDGHPSTALRAVHHAGAATIAPRPMSSSQQNRALKAIFTRFHRATNRHRRDGVSIGFIGVPQLSIVPSLRVVWQADAYERLSGCLPVLHFPALAGQSHVAGHRPRTGAVSADGPRCHAKRLGRLLE